MQTYKTRIKEEIITKHLGAFPAVLLLGARQVGKSTLAKKIIENIENSLYLDLEDPRDFAKLQEPLAYLEANSNSLICIDEVQRHPEIFQVFRSYLDKNNRPGQLLLLGSASRDLIKQSSETLAGRVSYIEISPFVASEVEDLGRLWVQGGYPDCYSFDSEMSFDWRINYIRTFLERDIPQLGIRVPAETLKRFWTMLAHINGSVLNQSSLASSMGVSVPTINNYLDILEGTFVIRRLKPFFTNTKKRLIKSPKIYIRDTGLIHCLLGIESYNELLGHPCLGNSYEAFIIASILEMFPRFEASFYRSSSGAEVDLILEKGEKKIAIEIKSSSVPRVTQGFYEALKVIKPLKAFVIAPVDKSFPLKEGVWVHNLKSVLEMNL
ncbi:MAG: ATP-binding protein [Spirochaetaceae bacterium]|jgi:predicted AAA+ superfamily ATPase|nr:ATP-binding protein [Spirochaetaceae bacterium]